ncbi:MAG: methyltransferase domain-containing protein [Pseudomonadota bacterium]
MSKYVMETDGNLPAPGSIFTGKERKYSDIKGIGVSDAHIYSGRLEKLCNYTNTFFHQEPYWDVTKPSPINDADFIISTDVFEHTPAPSEAPFKPVYDALKPGGKLFVSVPTHIEYIEHFPDMHNYQVVELTDGDFVLVNRTADDELEVFDHLRFHGGPGTTLEMRIYSIEKFEENLRDAGFQNIERVTDFPNEFGVYDIPYMTTLWVAEK